METEQSASTLGHLKDTRKRQSCHEIVIENWNITSLTAKENELVEEANRHSLDVVGISSSIRLRWFLSHCH